MRQFCHKLNLAASFFQTHKEQKAGERVMFSFILQIFIESLLYAETGVGSKNWVVNETEVVFAFVELIVRWRGHDSQLTTEINVQLFCEGNEEENTGCHDRETCVLWRLREGLPEDLLCWVGFEAKWQNNIQQANPCSCLISLLLPSVAILFTRKEGIFSAQAAQGQVTPLHVTVGPVWPALGGEGKSRWPTWACLSVISSPLSVHILPENQHIAKNLSCQ